MKEQFVPLKVRPETRRLAQKIAGNTGLKQYQIVDELLKRELKTPTLKHSSAIC